MATNLSNAQQQLGREVARLEDQAMTALSDGRHADALRLWKRLLEIAPGHAMAWTQVGQYAFKSGDFATARQAFERAAAAEGGDPRKWVNLAFACERLGDDAGVESALFSALKADPGDLMALFMRGRLREGQGRTEEAASSYSAAIAVAPPLEQLTPELRPAIQHAMAFHREHRQRFADFIDRYLEPHLADCKQPKADRFRLAVDILVGRKRRYDSQPLRFFMPKLEPQEFFPREQFPFLEELEAQTDAIRDELLAVVAADTGFEPYLQYREDQPLAQWAALNQSLSWSAFHLVKDGRRVAANADRCPRTMAAWSRTPAPEQRGRTPVALFSLLKPRTRIPPHVGASNARLLVHLPLVIPPGCSFRVGNTRREWVPGQAWVFDDTVEHEAWNDSDQLRVIMIFDTWHPGIDPAERRLISALSDALNAFGGEGPTGYEA